MVALPHRIRRLRWQVRAATRDEAFAIRAGLRRMHDADLVETFDRAFAAVPTGGAVLHVPRLELTLRIATLDQLQDALAASLHEALTAWRLPEKPAVAARLAGQTSSWLVRPADDAESSVSELRQADVHAALLQYLDTGTLPWALRNLGRERTSSLLAAVAIEQRERTLDAVPAVAERAAAFIRRWLQLLPPAEWVELARSVEARAPRGAEEGSVEALRSLAGLEVRDLSPADRQAVAVVLLLRALRNARRDVLSTSWSDAEAGGEAPVAWLETVMARLPPVARDWIRARDMAGRSSGRPVPKSLAPGDRVDRGQSVPCGAAVVRRQRDAPGGDELPRAAPAGVPSEVPPGETSRSRNGGIRRIDRRGGAPNTQRDPGRRHAERDGGTSSAPRGSGASPKSSGIATPPRGGVAPARPDIPARPHDTAAPRSQPGRGTHAEDEAATFGVAVEYAGLVLLHPFLPRLFERTAIADAHAMQLTEAALPRAAALLSYAARGSDDPLEFECAFIKVLLGLRLDAELPLAPGSLSDADRQEVDDLLASVVEHWRVLKHTSVAGLRSAFLQRRGLLTSAERSSYSRSGGPSGPPADAREWRLRVEPSAFDVLLDQLPWSISTVKLPWMTAPLFTEWMTP